MRLGTRLDRLEKKKEGHEGLLAFIGVPDNAGDLFEEAKRFWNEEKDSHLLDNVRGAVPWPSYSGDQIKFLGLGTYDDLYFGLCGGVRDREKLQFVFLSDVADLIENHCQEVKAFMDTHKDNRDDLGVSKEATEIMLCMCR